MWYKNFKDIWKDLTLGQRPNSEASNIQTEVWPGIHWNLWGSMDLSHLFTKKINKDTFWCSVGFPRHWSKEAFKPLHGSIDPRSSHTGMEPTICPKPLVMSAVCLLGVTGWREVGRGIIHRGNKHEFNPRAVKKMSFKVWTPLQVSRSYSMLSLNVAGKWYLVKGTFSLTQIPWQWLYQSTLQKRM